MLHSHGVLHHNVRRTVFNTRIHSVTRRSTNNDAAGLQPGRRKRGRPRKDAESTRGRQTDISVPPRAQPLAASSPHHNLTTFLAHARATSLAPTSPLYKGTRYEYLVADALSRYGLSVHRTGRSGDHGCDLLGTWKLPARQELRVLVSCKALAPTPAMLRELAGIYAGAPAGWRDSRHVMALLVAKGPASRGGLEGLQRSEGPMGMVQVVDEEGRVDDGEIKQLVWNQAANNVGLEGLGVTFKYRANGQQQIALTWSGRIWKSGH